jgi:hypothetical protein
MYLDKRTCVKNWSHLAANLRYSVSVLQGGKPTHIKPERVSKIIEEIAYWRKANAIHRWFVEHVQDGVDDCRQYLVSREQLAELLALVRTVLKERSRAAELLPTQEGYFFGDTEYGDWYFDDLRDTEKALASALTEPDSGRLYYSSSW